MVAWCVLVTVGTKSGLGYLRIWVQQHWCGVKGCRQADRQRNVQKQNAELESKEKLNLRTNKHTSSRNPSSAKLFQPKPLLAKYREGF